MKDIEKIKSEDLAAQVQDANPANFAIEQEVAAMVGATVPQPTEPSADDARELPAQLLVFLRRALLPIQTALRTALADIYAHLDSRCTAYTPAAYAPFRILPYDPMTTPRVPRTLPNLLTALTAFAPRKISNGSATADGIPDGTSLAHLLLSLDAANLVTAIVDDNTGWTLNNSKLKALLGLLPKLEHISLNGKGQLSSQISPVGNSYYGAVYNMQELVTLDIPEVTSAYTYSSGSDSTAMEACISQNPKLEEVYAPKIDTYTTSGNGNQFNALIAGCPALKKVTLGRVANNNYAGWGGTKWVIQYCQAIEKISVESLVENNCLVRSGQNANLIYLQIRGIQANSCNLSWWNPTDKGTTFLQNFREHIALRLTANGSGKTLTLSQAVFSAVIEGSSPICDEIKGIIEDKGWKVQDTNNNIFPTT